MTSTDLRQLIDDATAELPSAVSRPPLDGIRHRVQRRRMRLAGGVAGLAVLTTFSTAGLLGVSHDQHRPAPEPPRVAWQFGSIDDRKLIIFATRLGTCMELTDRRTEVTTADNVLTVSLFGTPVRGGDCGKVGFEMVQIDLAERPAGTVVRDGSDGRLRPIYDRADLPVKFADSVGVGFGWGSESIDGQPAEFVGDIQVLQGASEPPDGYPALRFRGTGLTTLPLSTMDGVPLTVGPVTGLLVRYRQGSERQDRYRFVWQQPRGESAGLWIGYELFTRQPVSRQKTIDLLRSLVWR